MIPKPIKDVELGFTLLPDQTILAEYRVNGLAVHSTVEIAADRWYTVRLRVNDTGLALDVDRLVQE